MRATLRDRVFVLVVILRDRRRLTGFLLVGFLLPVAQGFAGLTTPVHPVPGHCQSHSEL